MGSGDDVTQDDTEAGGNVRGKGSPSRTRRTHNQHPSEAFGSALRSVYQEAVHEDVPDDLLDLLRKLD